MFILEGICASRTIFKTACREVCNFGCQTRDEAHLYMHHPMDTIMKMMGAVGERFLERNPLEGKIGTHLTLIGLHF